MVTISPDHCCFQVFKQLKGTHYFPEGTYILVGYGSNAGGGHDIVSGKGNENVSHGGGKRRGGGENIIMVIGVVLPVEIRDISNEFHRKQVKREPPRSLVRLSK